MARSVIKIDEAVHEVVERALKGAPVSNRRRRDAAQEEALRLRTETAQREQHKFGKKTAKALTDADPGYMSDGDTAVGIEPGNNTINPSVIDQLPGIMLEIQAERLSGRLRPFVEGEPIGACRNSQRRGPTPALKTRAEIMYERQKALRERQRRNDATLESLLRGRR